jgi:glycosyltransferase involved in cell wall biosynthesis
MVILEAFACARPVIGSELGGIPELIVENATGTIVPPNDPQALAEAIQPYVDDSSRAHAMGLAARQGAVADFSSAAHLSGLERIYARAGESTVVR